MVTIINPEDYIPGFNSQDYQPRHRIGNSTTAVAMTAYNDNITRIYTSSADTSGSSVQPFYHQCTMSGIGGVGGRAMFYMTTNVALGGWSNALKGHVAYGSSGRTAGMGSAVCGEIELSAGTSSGTYAPLESEVVLAANAVTGTGTSFIYCNATGASVATFDTNGLLFEIGAGITINSGKFFQANTAGAASHALRCKVDGSIYYVMLTNTAA